MDVTTWIPEKDTLWVFTLPNYNKNDETTIQRLWESFKAVIPVDLRTSAIRSEMAVFPVALIGSGGLHHLADEFFTEGYTNQIKLKEYRAFAKEVEISVSNTLEDRSFMDTACVFLVSYPSFSLIKPLETVMSKIKGYSQVEHLQHFSSGKEKVTVFVME